MSSVHIALAVSGHLGVNMVDRGRVVQRPLCKGQIDSKNARVSQTIVTLWSSGRHLALGSGGPGFESWLCQVNIESLGKALYMHFLTPLMCKKSTRL